MRKILLILLLLGIVLNGYPQKNSPAKPSSVSTSFSFACSKDTTISCGPPCISINGVIPDLNDGTGTYKTVLMNNGSCFQPYVAPNFLGATSTSTSLTVDDVYSGIINIGFTFPFFGANYTNLIASTNGYISFDISKAGAASGFTVAADLPSSTYDRAVIMGPFHDLDPSSRANPPATMLIKYDVLGSAPYRRWVFSFNTVPLYSTTAATCGVLNQNTHQIVLYESLGIVEIFIKDKQICTVWNSGKSLLGMQDFNRTTAIMAPGRAASSVPWGTVGMNEAWRFCPSGGASLFKSVELYDMAGTLVSTGTAVSAGNGNMNVSFPNVCAPLNATTSYVIKSTYKKIDDPFTDIYGTDTINVIRQSSLPVTGVATATNCGVSTGTITASVTGNAGTAPYQFSLDGGPLSANNFFTGLAAGNHTLYGEDFSGCFKTVTVFVPTNNAIPATFIVSNTSCPGVNNGSITVTPGGGTAPYSYSINAGPTQLSNVFTGLGPNTYTVNFTDAGGCSGSITTTISAGLGITGTSTFVNTGCSAVNNGTATAVPTSGTAPYTFSLNGGPFQPGGTFTGLAPNFYTITIKDANGCTGSQSGTILAGAALTSTLSTVPPTCAGFTNGSVTVVPTTGTAPYSFSLNGGPSQLSGTFNGLSAGVPYTVSFSDALGCTGTTSTTLVPVSPLAAGSSVQDANCFGDNNGSIIINPSGGTSPYQYSIDAGVTYQPSATFSGLIAGTYSIRTKDANNCTVNTPVTINQPSLLTGSAVPTASTCNGNDGQVSFSAAGGTTPYEFSINNAVAYQVSNLFTVVPATYNNLKVRDAHGCIANVTPVTVTLLDTMRLTFGPDLTTCEGTAVTLNPQTNSQTSIFSWTPAKGLNDSTLQNPAANPADSTIYTLTAKWGACQRTASTRVNILTKPIAHAGRDTAICFQTFAFLRGSATRTSGAVNYLWSPAAKALPANAAFGIGRPDSTQVFTLEVSDNYGCNFKTYDDVLITMQPPVPAYAGNDTNAVYGIPHQLFSRGGVSYLWSPSNVLDNPLSQFPLATLTSDTRFTVLVTDIAGCIGTDDVLIKVYKGPTYYVPNAFSPNGDGRNDIFRPTPVGIVSTDYFRVFNRYGQLVFETNKWLEGWNGRFQGKLQAQGTYPWMIRGTDRNGKVVEMKGTVILIQ